VIRIVLEAQLRVPLLRVLAYADRSFTQAHVDNPHGALELVSQLRDGGHATGHRHEIHGLPNGSSGVDEHPAQLLAFFADRLKVLLRDQGQRHDLVDAVFALGDDDLVRIVARVAALDAFLTTADGANLLAGYRRAVNILRAEAKKGALPDGAAEALTTSPPEEIALIDAVKAVAPAVSADLEREDFAAAMRALSSLREPVDAFFDQVLVNSEVAAERDNRLRLLGQVRRLMNKVADFSQISG